MKKRSNLEIALEHEYNFRSRNECPSQNKRFTKKIFYQANVENDINNDILLWVSEKAVKKHFGTKKKKFPIAHTGIPQNCFKYVWYLKDLKTTAIITWQIMAITQSDIKINYCKLCLTEKLFIISFMITGCSIISQN